MDNKSIRFLAGIYEQQCEEGDYVILAARKGKTWRDVPILFHKSSFRKDLVRAMRNYPQEEWDLYWSPMAYSGPNRRLVNARDSKFLCQDIDEMEDPESLNPKPSYIWESSPNKYQGLWEMDRYIKQETYTDINKALAKHIGCDDCFDFTHVYRIPGTINHKYRNNPDVGFPISTKAIYKPRNLLKLIGGSREKKNPSSPPTNTPATLQERKIYAKYSIPKKVRDLLAVEDISDLDRSSTIWYIENKLQELGMQPAEIIHLVKNSSFNKYKGRPDEDKRLRAELDKILEGRIIESGGEIEKFKLSTYGDLMSSNDSFGGWLVKGFWGRRSHGMVAGMPKCFKSTLVHDLIVSVASGKPFLGKYPVLDPGPVIVVQNENADYVMKDRTEKLIYNRGLGGKTRIKGSHNIKVEFPPELPIYFINQQGFLLNNEEHRKNLEDLIKEINPVLVVLDPLYLMFDGDLNSAKELNPALNWLLRLKNEYNTSIMLIHHYNKGGAGATKGGARMMGSIILYGWVESAWYLSKPEEEDESEDDSVDMENFQQKPTTITMEREFRMAGKFPIIDVHLDLGEMGDPKYNITVTRSGEGVSNPKSLEEDIINALQVSTIPLTKSELLQRLMVNRSKLNEALDRLIKDKSIKVKGNGFTIYR